MSETPDDQSPSCISFRDNQIIKTSEDANRHHYKFRSPYEICINECLARNIIVRPGQRFIHLDVTGTDAQKTLSNFVTEVAKTVGLDKTVNINNILLELDFNSVKLDCDPMHMEMIIDDPCVLKDTHIEAVIEWAAFNVLSEDMGVQLTLSQITVIKLNEREVTRCNHSKQTPKLSDVIRNTTPNIVPQNQAPDLYKSLLPFNITFEILHSGERKIDSKRSA